jgi:hypothetical protein
MTTDTDKILLEQAAKAAGIEVTWTPEYRSFFLKGSRLGQRLFWNPLTDDGDALRLAVKLNLKFRYHEVLGQALVWPTVGDGFELNVEDCDSNPYTATRRAIVIVAAELGKNL